MEAVVVIICSVEIFSSLPDRRRKVIEIISAICALLNSDGGKVVLTIGSHEKPGKRLFSTQRSSMIRILEQSMVSIIGTHQTFSNIRFECDDKKLEILIEKAASLITTNYNLYLPSHTQVMHLPATESLDIIRGIMNRKDIPKAIVSLGSHCKRFRHFKNCNFEQSKMDQFKRLKSHPSKRTTLADRITGRGNKFSCYVSAFANYNGGHIYYGITDDCVVEGEFIPSEEEKRDVTKKVEKALNKMIWPKQIGQPKRGEHWEIFFEPVVHENSEPIPSTFVIVIYIAHCLGGVFSAEPESYEMVNGKVEKISFGTWKKRMFQPVWLRGKEEIPHSVGRITWSSDSNRKACNDAHQVLIRLINNGKWNDISKSSKYLEKKYPQLLEIKLLVLSKWITARYRRGHFNKAQALLQEYTDILPQAQDLLIFEVLRLYLNAALKRASGDLVGLKKFLFAALSQAESIEPGLVPAMVYVFAATVTDLISNCHLVKSEDQTDKISPQLLSIKALQHLECVPDPSKVLVDMKQKSHITLATFYLGCNISGQRVKGSDVVRLNEAKRSIMAVLKSTCEGSPPSKYREVQLNLAQSIYYCRYSQDAPQRARYLGDAFNYAMRAERLARDNQFMEMVEWSKTHKALWTEELLRTRLSRKQ